MAGEGIVMAGRPPKADGDRVVMARHVPDEIYWRVRRNASDSRLTFNEYLLRLLAGSEPLPPTGEETT